MFLLGHESTDPVVKLAAAVFRLSEIERRAVEAGFKTLLSPEVSCSIMWFLRRWVLTYLAGPENCYSDISIAILSAFGQNTEGAAWTIGFVLEKIISNLTAMNSEPSVVQDTVKLLVAMVDSKERGKQVLKSPVLNNLAICIQNQGIDELPSEAKRGKYNTYYEISTYYYYHFKYIISASTILVYIYIISTLLFLRTFKSTDHSDLIVRGSSSQRCPLE